MAYVINNYLDWDLKLKTPRSQPARAKPDLVVRYVQIALVDLKIPKVNGKVLNVDGLYGPQTTAAIKMFQDAVGLPVTGKLDQATYNELDWRVYGELSGNWKQAPKTTNNIKPGGPAIIARGGLAYNEILRTKGVNPKLPAAAIETINGAKWSLVPVDVIGRTREGARLSDVPEAQFGRALGYEGAVRRNAVGSSQWSWHWTGLAGDDMADQDRDKVVELSELIFQKAVWDYMVLRANALGSGPNDYVKATRYVRLPGEDTVRSKSSPWRGLERMAIQVVGNRQLGTAGLMFPQCRPGLRDVSWNGERNAPRCGTGTVHVAPQHLHSDCVPGAPYGSPF